MGRDTVLRLFDAFAFFQAKRHKRVKKHIERVKNVMINLNHNVKVLNTGTCRHLLNARGFIWSLIPELHHEGHSNATKLNNIPYVIVNRSLLNNE